MASKKIAGITAKLGLDVSGVTSALNEIDKESRNLVKEMKSVNDAMKVNPESVVLASQKQEILSRQIEITVQKLRELEDVQKKADNAFKAQAKWEEQYAPLKAAIDAAKEKLKELQAQNEQMKSDLANGKISAEQYEAYQNELDSTKAKMKELAQAEKDLEASFTDGHISAEEYRAYQREVELTTSDLIKLMKQQDDLGKSADDMGKDIKDASDDIKDSAKNVKSYEDAVKDLNSAVKDVQGDLSEIATAAGAALAAVGTATIGAVTEATKVGMDFEKSMSNVQAVSGASAEDLARLGEAAKLMGSTTSKTASEAADALGYMALAGWKTEDMLTGLEPILRASEAGQMDLASASDLITDSMAAMGVEVEDLGHYLDVVTKAQSSSNTSMQQLLEAFKVTGGTAHNLGIDVEELSTILGVMANRGIKGSEAGTALNAVLVNMLGSTKRTAEAMDTLGLSMFDEQGNTKNMTEVLHEMGDALSVCTDEQKAMLEAQLGGKTQMDALQAIINGVGEEYDNLAVSLNNADGALMATAKTMQDNLAGRITEMQSALEGLGIDVYSHFEEPFKDAVEAVTKEIGNLAASVKGGQLSEVLGRLAASLSELLKRAAEFAVDEGIPKLINSLDWISRNGDAIEAVITGMGTAWATWKISTMAGHVQQLIKALQTFKTAQEGATAAQIAANEAAMANVYAVVAAAVVALTAALAKLVAARIDDAAYALRHQNDLDAETQAIIDQNNELSKLNEGYKDHAKNADSLAETEHALWNEIQGLVDEEGKATGSAEELESAVSKLNAISDLNIQVVGGQIQGYGELKNSIDNVIEAQRRQAKLSYLSEGYGEAVANIDAAKQAVEEAGAEYDELAKKHLQYQDWLDEAKRTKIVPDDYSGSYDQLLSEAQQVANEFTEATVKYNGLKQTVSEYQETIDNYENALGDKTKAKGKVAGESFSDGYEDGAKSTTKTVETSVNDIINSAYDSAVASGKSVGSAAADALTAAIESGVEGSDLKKLVSNYINDIKYEQARMGADDSWFLDEQEKAVSVLGENSDLYKQYMTDILNKRKAISDAKAKQSQKDVTNAQKAADDEAKATRKAEEDKAKAIEDAAKQKHHDLEIKKLNGEIDDKEYYKALEKDVMSQLDKGSLLYQQYEKEIATWNKKIRDEQQKQTKEDSRVLASFSGVFTSEVNSSGNTIKKIDTQNIEKIIRAKEQLTGVLTELAGKGMPQSVIAELLNMDPVDALQYARMLLKFPNKFESIKQLGERNDAAQQRLANILPNLSAAQSSVIGINASQANTQAAKTEANNAQTETATNTNKSVALLESVLGLLMTRLSENGISIDFKPTIENILTLDGEKVAANTTEWQTKKQIQTNG